MKKRRRAINGFTIAEILIAIGVITIALLGTIAAIAFGLRASKLGADNTVAIQVNRKVLELILQGIYPAKTSSQFNHNPGVPTDPRGAVPWRPVLVPNGTVPQWFELADYGFPPIANADSERFKRDTLNCELDVSAQMVNPIDFGSNSFSPSNLFRRIIVQTRWQDKGNNNWKVVRTEAYGLPEGP